MFFITGIGDTGMSIRSQLVGLDYLIPLALESLEDNILLEGNFYCGDLLNLHWKVYSRALDLGNKKKPFVWFEGLFYKPSFTEI
jgi:hypothetical protein